MPSQKTAERLNGCVPPRDCQKCGQIVRSPVRVFCRQVAGVRGRQNQFLLFVYPLGRGNFLDGAVRTYPSPQEQRRRQQQRCVVVDCHGTAVAWLQPTIGTAASQRFVDRLVDAAGCSCGVCTHPPAAAVQQAPHVVPTVSHFQKKNREIIVGGLFARSFRVQSSLQRRWRSRFCMLPARPAYPQTTGGTLEGTCTCCLAQGRTSCRWRSSRTRVAGG